MIIIASFITTFTIIIITTILLIFIGVEYQLKYYYYIKTNEMNK